MATRRRFPAIICRRRGDEFEALAGLELKSILRADLFPQEERAEPYHPLNPKYQQGQRETMLHAVSAWSPDVCLEMRLAALPDLLNKPQGRMRISLVIRSSSGTEEGAKEAVISRYMSLVPLLASHLREAEFAPITEEEELLKTLHFFSPTHAAAIRRRQETISLSTPLKRLSVGFTHQLPRVGLGKNSIRHTFPWAPSSSDWHSLLETLMGQLDPIEIIMRVRPSRPDNDVLEKLRATIRTCEEFLSGIKDMHVTLNRQASLLRDISLRQLADLSTCSFKVGVFIRSCRPVDPSLGNVLGRAITAQGAGANETDLFQGGFSCEEVSTASLQDAGIFPEETPYTLREAACAFRLPSPPREELVGLPVRRSRSSPVLLPPEGMNGKGVITLAVNEHLGVVQPIHVGIDDRMRHTFIIGQTGTGKSTLMESMVLQDIRAGRGVALIDPHGELVEAVLGKIPEDRRSDVILFDLLEKKRPLGFNLLQWKTPEERDLIIDELYLTLDRIYDMRQAGGPIFESNFRGMLKLLMGDKRTQDFVPTLLEFTLCYLESGLRKWLKKRVSDPQTLDFLNELERTGGDGSLQNLSPYITSKFSRFIHDATLKRIVGQEKTGFDFEEILNHNKIFLVNLGKGRFGSNSSALLANQIVARFKLEAMKRGEMRPEERKDFVLYVDEAHNLPSENFCELLSEARKYRMGLVLATQYTAQLLNERNGNSLLSAILGNVGTILIFRLGYEDAQKLSPILHPNFTAADIVGLPNWQGYAHMQLHNQPTPPFSFRSEMDPTPYRDESASSIRNWCQAHYGLSCKRIDARIERRRSLWKEEKSE